MYIYELLLMYLFIFKNQIRLLDPKFEVVSVMFYQSLYKRLVCNFDLIRKRKSHPILKILLTWIMQQVLVLVPDSGVAMIYFPKMAGL